jgi:predicted nucleic acid-binding protein
LTGAVILDTDFLSAFLKIEQLSLVRDFYGVPRLSVPPAVYREVSITPLLLELVRFEGLEVQASPEQAMRTLSSREGFDRLGQGEREAIALATSQEGSVLLTNDNQARLFAVGIGLQAVNVPAFLLACKLSGLLSRDEVAELVVALEAKDRYRFRADVRALLLS